MPKKFTYVNIVASYEDFFTVNKDLKENEKIWEKVRKLVKEVENDLPLKLPRNSTMKFTIVPRGRSQSKITKFSAAVEINIPEESFAEWEEFIREWGPSESVFIKKIVNTQRGKFARGIEEILKEKSIKEKQVKKSPPKKKISGKTFSKEKEKVRLDTSIFGPPVAPTPEIDKAKPDYVMVQGNSGVYKVKKVGNEWECDCHLYTREGRCHHVELVKNLEEIGILNDIRKLYNNVIESPKIVKVKGRGFTTFNPSKYQIEIPEKDEDPNRTMVVLNSYGYGIGAIKKMKYAPRKMKWNELQQIKAEIGGREFPDMEMEIGGD